MVEVLTRDIRLIKWIRLKETIEFPNKLKFKALQGLNGHVVLNPYTNRITQWTENILKFIIFVPVISFFYAYSYSLSKFQWYKYLSKHIKSYTNITDLYKKKLNIYIYPRTQNSIFFPLNFISKKVNWRNKNSLVTPQW